MSRITPLALAFLSLMAVAGCGAAKAPAAETDSTTPDTAAPDSAAIVRLERRARALAHTRGCTRASDCRVAPVGVRPCGGPRDYVAYCAASTDTVALFRALGELERVERAYNQRSHLMGSCQMQLPPAVALAGGSCGTARTP